jgi:hypothetical protein
MHAIKHNPKFGETYEASPVMKTYLQSLKSLSLLRYGLSFFTSEFIFGEKYEQILESMYNRSLCKIGVSPNTMYKYGASDVITMDELDKLKMSLLPYIYEVFGIDPCKKCYLFTNFSVHYSNYHDTKLDEHMDDSEITVNICLKNTQNFTGLKFNQIPDTLFSFKDVEDVKEDKTILVNLEMGDILIHSGKQRHEVVQTVLEDTNHNGQQVNLILWFKFSY